MSISRQTFIPLLQHALLTQAHGRAFERRAELQKGWPLNQEQASAIKYSGQQIQKYGESMAALAEQVIREDKQDYYEQYCLINKQQHQVMQHYMTAIQKLLEAIEIAILSVPHSNPIVETAY